MKYWTLIPNLRLEREMSARKFLILAFLISFMLTAGAFAYQKGSLSAPNNDVNARGLIVKFKDDVKVIPGTSKRGVITTGIKSVDDLNVQNGISRVESLGEKFKSIRNNHPLKKVFVFSAENRVDYQRLADDYSKLSEVEFAEPDYEIMLFDYPDDPYFHDQWNIFNIGQGHPAVFRYEGDSNDVFGYTSGIAGADIDADTTYLDPPSTADKSIVAIIDTGVDTEHPELHNKIWTNPGEIDNGIDDDNNGYVDDIYGYDISDDDNDVSDYMGHGTHCAGIVTAVTDNAIGVSAVCPDAEIMPVKIFPNAFVTNLVEGILYAANMGADVVNMSLGQLYPSILLDQTLEYAQKKGVVLCAATGNFGSSLHVFPALSPYVIAVGATNDSDHVTSFSSYGDHIDLVAPGKDILSLRAEGTDMYAPKEPDVHIFDSIYYISDGTSMACPHAVGVAAYLKAIAPGIDPVTVQTIMENGADDLVDPYGTNAYLPGWDKYSGHGRLNLYNCIDDPEPLFAKITDPLPHVIQSSSSIPIFGTAAGDAFRKYTVEYGEGYLPESWTTINTAYYPVTDGQLAVFQTGGMTGPVTVRVTVNDKNYDMVSFFVADSAVAEITYPTTSSFIVHGASIIGSAYNSDFEKYVLKYKPSGAHDSEYVEIKTSTVPLEDTVLADWKFGDLADGEYDLLLEVYSSGLVVTSDLVTVTLTPSGGENYNYVDLPAYPAMTANYSDYDNDQQYEILVATWNGMRVFNPDGTPKTTGMPTFPEGEFRTAPAVGNLDGDGIDDIVILKLAPDYENGHVIYGYRSTGGEFQIDLFPHGIGGTGTGLKYLEYIVLEDVTDDGIDDIFIKTRDAIIYCEVGYSNQLRTVNGNAVQIADLNGDGSVEIYVADGKYLREYTGAWTYVRTINLTAESKNVYSLSMSTYDIDEDGLEELIVFGDNITGHWLFAFDGGLVNVDGWPRFTGIQPENAPTHPVFGDIDEDGTLDYITSIYDIYNSYIFAWKINGEPYRGDTPLFALPPFSARITKVLLTDIDGDHVTDVVANANNGAFFTNPGQRLLAYDAEGNMLPDYPVELHNMFVFNDMYDPLVNDLDGDGLLDMIYPLGTGEMLFIDFPYTYWDTCSTPNAMFRYDRSFTGRGPSYGPCEGFLCGDVNHDWFVDWDDVDYLIAWMFEGGPPPIPMESGNVNCDSSIDISDVVWLVNYLQGTGPAPCDCEGGQFKLASAGITLDYDFKEGYTTIRLNSEIELAALEFELDKNSALKPVSSIEKGMDVIGSSKSSKFALVDKDGIEMLKPGEYEVARIEGEFNIISATASDAGGLSLPVVIKGGDSNMLPKKFAFDQNYPNPFNPTTTFSFSLPAEQHVELTIFNILGQEVVKLVDEVLPAGRHQVVWDGNNAQGGVTASGIYFAKMKAGEFSRTRKISLLK